MQRLPLVKFILLVLSLYVSFSAAAVDERYYQLADSADRCIREENWPGAEKFILQALRLEPSAPGNVMLMSNLSIVQMQQGRCNDALRTINDAVASEPRSLTLLYNRARINTALHNDDDAIADYTQMLQIDSLSVKALYGRGLALLARHDLEGAERDLLRLEVSAPESSETHQAMATLRSLRGEYEKAEAHYSELIKKSPTDEYYMGRASCRMMMGQYSEASEDLTEAIKLNPDNPEIYVQRAQLSKLTYRMPEYDMDMRMARKLGYKGPM